MKFLHYAALVGAACAARLTQTSAVSVHSSMKAGAKLHVEAKQEDEGQIWAELEAWGEAELADGGTITKEEAHAKISALAAEHNIEVSEEMWHALEQGFDMVDTNKDGEIDIDEMNAVMHAHQNVEWPTEEEVIAWMRGELDKDGNISFDEVKAALEDWAKGQNYTIPEQMWAGIEAGFNYLDANGDGVVDYAELQKVMPHLDEPHPPTDDDDDHEEGPDMDALKAYLEAEMGKDGELSWKEARKGIKNFNKPHKLPKEAWKSVKHHFDMADTDGSGKVSQAELDAAFAHHD